MFGDERDVKLGSSPSSPGRELSNEIARSKMTGWAIRLPQLKVCADEIPCRGQEIRLASYPDRLC